MPGAAQTQIGRGDQEAIIHFGIVFGDVKSQHSTANKAEPPVYPGNDHREKCHYHNGLPGLLFVGPTGETVQQAPDGW